MTIERAIRAVMEIEDDTLLRVTLDGRRLLIEPVVGKADEVSTAAAPARPPDPDLALRRAAVSTLRRLGDYGLWEASVIERFHHLRYKRAGAYLGWLMHFAMDTADERELAAMRRNAHCLALLDAGRTLEEAMAEALRVVPLVTTA